MRIACVGAGPAANISRSIDRPPAQFATLLHARRVLQLLVPPWGARRLRLDVTPIVKAVLR